MTFAFSARPATVVTVPWSKQTATIFPVTKTASNLMAPPNTPFNRLKNAGSPRQSGRFVAVQALVLLEKGGSPAKVLLERLSSHFRLPELERNLAMQLVFGVLRHRQVLERMITLLSRTPPKKIDPHILQTLAVGLYQLFFLDRIPAPAAVHATVEVCKGQRLPQRLEGFVNGILRQALRDKERLATEARFGAAGEPLLNHPPWLIARWQHRFGIKETERICHCNNQEPLLVLRANTTKISRDLLLDQLVKSGLAAEKGTYAGDALVLPGYHGKISALPGYQEGHFQVQDEAAQLAASLFFPLRPGGVYLDGCAGVGGKTTLLLQNAKDLSVQVHAVEPQGGRLLRLRENVTRLGLTDNLTVHETTLQGAAVQLKTACDGVLIDAPCSGTGVIGRQPDIRWNRQPEDLQVYRREQLSLLESAARLLAPGGILVYATCSLEPEENEEVVGAFLASHPSMVQDDCTPYLPEGARKLVVGGYFSPRPDTTIDGFFAARLRNR